MKIPDHMPGGFEINVQKMPKHEKKIVFVIYNVKSGSAYKQKLAGMRQNWVLKHSVSRASKESRIYIENLQQARIFFFWMIT